MNCLYKIEKDIFFLMKKEYYDNIFLEYSIPLISDEAEKKKKSGQKKERIYLF